MIKRYLLFAGDTYYPGGGWDDYIGDFDTVDEAVKTADETPGDYIKLRGMRVDWWHVVDIETGSVVKSSA